MRSGANVMHMTHERLRMFLDFNPETGVFTYKTPRQGIRAGNVAGCLDGEGYRRIMVDGHLYRAHRLAWFYVFGEWPEDQLDHANGNRDDNRLANLRMCNQAENRQNAAIPSTNTSGFLGVSWDKKSNKWAARIKVNGRQRRLGCYASPEEAHQAYLAERLRLHKFQPVPRDGSARAAK